MYESFTKEVKANYRFCGKIPLKEQRARPVSQ